MTGPKVEGAREAGGAAGRGCGAVGVGTKLALAAGAGAGAVTVAVVVAIGGGRGEGAEAAVESGLGVIKKRRKLMRACVLGLCVGPPVMNMPS